MTTKKSTSIARKASEESDPTGLGQHEPGAKLDGGKVRPALVLRGFALALQAVAEVGTDGAYKYTDNGWKEVANGEDRYEEACERHKLRRWSGELTDQDSKSLHLVHEAWNKLAQLTLHLEKQQ